MKHLLRLPLLLLIFVLLSSAAFAQNKDWLVKMQDPNVNFWELQKEFNDYWKDRTDYKGNGYKVFKRWEYINETRVQPNGKLQAPGYVLKEYQRYMAEAGVKESASGTWASVGPTAYPANNTTQPTGMGRVNAIAFHPTDPNTIFVGAPSGGIWKTTNGGTNWTNLSSNIPYLGVSAILIHPSNPNIIYIGTGDRDGTNAPGIGVYKSTDGGATWASFSSGMGDATVGMMLMHPSDPNTIIAATKSGIFKSTNGGASWTLRQAGDFRDIKFKPGDPSTMYATRLITPSEFYRSTDNGNTWGQITTPTTDVGSRMVIGVSPANASIVYLVQIKSADRTFKAFLKSTDSGLTFTEQSNSPNILGYNCDGSGTASQATYDLCIDVDRSNANIVYIGSINSWKSTDGGVNWNAVTHWVGSNNNPVYTCALGVHADHHWYEWSPLHSPARLYLGHDGGISYTADGGATWTEITNDLVIGQSYKIGQSPQAANTVMAGFQDNGSAATTNASGYTTLFGGDGFECQIDYDDPNFCYLSAQGAGLRRSTTGVLGMYSSIIPMAVNDDAAFSAPYMLHRTVPNTMFMGRENVWRSTNIRANPTSAISWETISSFAAGSTIRVMEQSQVNLDLMYMSRGVGGSSVLYRSDNVNAAANSVVWNTITKPGGQAPTDIKAHPTDENIVYATAGMQVFKSTDKGQTWTDITGNLPALFINCLAIDKDANEGIYIGNQTTVWYKDATMTDWALFSAGLPPVDIRELEIYYDVNPSNSRISAATYGRGIWQSDLIQVNVIDPSDLATTPNSTTQIDLTWTLNASNNNVLIATSPTTTFGVPLDGTGYSAGNTLPGGGTVIYVGNLTNFSHTALTAGTEYCYKIWSVNGSNQYSAGLTPVCTSTLSHNWTGNVNTDWFNTGNWGPGTVPTATDGAYFPAGRPNYPLINASGATCYHLTIEAGASVSMHAATPYTLNVTGDWLNNGTLNRGVGTVSFSGANALQTIRGSSTTAFNILQVNKGAQENILEAKSLISLNAAANPLVLNGGTFKLSSASTIMPFTSSAGASLTASAGFWNNGGTITAGGFSWTLNGALLRVSAGTVNVGTAGGNSIVYLNNGTLIMEGGALNIAARFNPVSGASTGTYTQTGGAVTVFTVGSTSTTLAPFELNPGVPFTMSGGTLAIRRQSSNTAGEIIIASTAHSVTGGTLQIGDASTPAAQTIRINSTAPIFNLAVNATNAPTAQLLTNGLTVLNDVTIAGGTLNANNLNLNVGGHWTNNGAFTPGTGTVTFDGTANQNLAGSTATTFNNLTLNNAAGLTLSGSANTTVNGALTLSSGVISTGSNSLVIPSTGSVARTSGHIFGNLQKHVASGAGISRTFEIGDAAAANYTPATVTFASVSTPGNLKAQSVAGDHPQIGSATLNASKSVNRYWSLTNSGTAFTTYDAVFNFLTGDLDPAVNTSALVCGKYDAPNWTYPTVGTTAANSTEITGLASFSDFQLAEFGGCVNPDVPTLNATANPVCASQPTTLSIATGNLNGAADWQWYSGSCGGTPEGAGASIIVSPGSATTYYARGEGGCVVTPGTCGNIAITVNPVPTPTVTGPSLVCSGDDALLDAGAGYAAYAWSNSGGSSQTATFSNITTTTTYTVTVTDGNNCQGTDTYTVTVGDTQAPGITCPANIVVNNAPGLCDAPVSVLAPAVTDNCDQLELGNGLNFDGINDIAFVGASSPINTASQSKRTVEVYFRVNDKNINTHKQVIWEEGAHFTGLNIYVYDGQLYYGIYSKQQGWDGTWVSTPAIQSGQWHNAVLVYDGAISTQRLKAYLDGVLVASADESATLGSLHNAHPGNNAAGALYDRGRFHDGDDLSAEAHYFSGDIDEIRLWTVARSAVELAATTTVQLAGNEPGLAVYYNFDQGTACADNTGINFLDDITATNLDGTMTGFALDGSQGCTSNWTYGSPAISSSITLINSYTGTASASGTYPVGVTNVTWTATDLANNTTSCIQTVTVNDTEAPSVACPANLTVTPTINSPCSEIVNSIDATFDDNCAGSTLAYALSGATTGGGGGQASGQAFLSGVTTVIYTATDGANLTSSCMFTVTVGTCVAPNLEFSGTIKWEHDGTSGVKDATVNLTGAGTGSALTDVNGDYLISIPPTSGNFTIKPVKNINRLNGVTSADVSAVQLHVVGTTLLPAPFKIIAADVTRNGSVSTTDVTVINQCLLGNPSALNIFSVFWRFVPAGHVFPNPNSPLLGIPEQINLTGVSTNQTGLDFKGIKLGDVVATFANPANFGAGEPLVWRVNDRLLQLGETFEVEFRADQLNDLTSFQFALRFDPEQLSLDGVEPLNGLPGVSEDNFGLYNLAEGEIRMVWAQTEGQAIEEATPVFRLKFTALDSGRKLSEVLHLENSILTAYSYNSDFAESGVQMKYTETTATGQPDPGAGLILLQNQPNPFSQSTKIGFVLPEAAEAQLRIYNVSGKLIQQISKQYPAGYHVEEIQLEGMPGVLSYELLTPYGTLTKRMVRVARP